MRELLEQWQDAYPSIFKVVFCVGSRWTNVHWGAKTKNKDKEEYIPPVIPKGFEELKNAELVSEKEQ